MACNMSLKYKQIRFQKFRPYIGSLALKQIAFRNHINFRFKLC